MMTCSWDSGSSLTAALSPPFPEQSSRIRSRRDIFIDTVQISPSNAMVSLGNDATKLTAISQLCMPLVTAEASSWCEPDYRARRSLGKASTNYCREIL
jgi:hypothetical protein